MSLCNFPSASTAPKACGQEARYVCEVLYMGVLFRCEAHYSIYPPEIKERFKDIFSEEDDLELGF